MVMNKITLLAAVMTMLVFASPAKGSACVLVNGSFEDDGPIDDINDIPPSGWDVNYTHPDKFFGYVDTDWATHGNYNLTLYSNSWYVTFDGNEMATVSQEVCLSDVNEIVFDLYLDTVAWPWDPSKITPVLLIDNDVVWDMTGAGSDIRGAHPNEIYDVDDIYQDTNLHKLSLGLKVNVSGQLTDIYYSDWDNVRLNIYCDGFGLLSGDLDRDCYVDANDLKMLAEVWLDEVGPNSKYNLFRDDADPNGLVDFRDFSMFADNWLKSSYD